MRGSASVVLFAELPRVVTAALALGMPLAGLPGVALGQAPAPTTVSAAPVQADDAEVAPRVDLERAEIAAPADQVVEVVAEPPLMHYLATLGMGVPLRVTRTDELGQGTLSSVFLDGLLAIAFPVGSRVQHGIGLGASIGMSEDGGFYEPTPAGSQAVLMPTYVAYFAWQPDLFCLGHLGVPVLLAGGRSVGLELAAALGYRLLAGFGLYGELGVAGFAGAQSRFNVAASLELGLFVDYEVLP